VTQATGVTAHSRTLLRACLPLALAAALALARPHTGRLALPVEPVESIGGLPAHVAGRFQDMTACQQAADGQYFVFDRRAHAVFAIGQPYDAVREIVRIGAESGRLLRPTAFHLAQDGRFVVADAPGSQGRIQLFLTTGASVGGFRLASRDVPTLVFENFLLSGIGSLSFTGQSVVLSQPELGTLVSEYSLDGSVSRTFGTLRPTGHEQDREVHLALNTGLPIINPRGGFYYVFLGGVPMFRKYDASGTLLFERHIEGPELDLHIRSLPTTWPRTRTEAGELPIVQPGVRAAAADADGNLWISLTAPFTYVYDSVGDKRRTIQFRGAGVISPRSLFFTSQGRVLVTPGCYAFPGGERGR
jgi:hypothetical protein